MGVHGGEFDQAGVVNRGQRSGDMPELVLAFASARVRRDGDPGEGQIACSGCILPVKRVAKWSAARAAQLALQPENLQVAFQLDVSLYAGQRISGI
jgi:hypothetical protein